MGKRRKHGGVAEARRRSQISKRWRRTWCVSVVIVVHCLRVRPQFLTCLHLSAPCTREPQATRAGRTTQDVVTDGAVCPNHLALWNVILRTETFRQHAHAHAPPPGGGAVATPSTAAILVGAPRAAPPPPPSAPEPERQLWAALCANGIQRDTTLAPDGVVCPLRGVAHACPSKKQGGLVKSETALLQARRASFSRAFLAPRHPLGRPV